MELRIELALKEVDGSPAQGTYALLIHQPTARPHRSTHVQRDVTPSAEGRLQTTLELPDWIDARSSVEVMVSAVDLPVTRESLDKLWLDPVEGRRAIHLGTPAPTNQDSVFELAGLTLDLQPAPVQWELTIEAPTEELFQFEYQPDPGVGVGYARTLEFPTNRPTRIFGWGDHFHWLVRGRSEAGLALPETTLGLSQQVRLATTEQVSLAVQVRFQLWEEYAHVVLRPYASPPNNTFFSHYLGRHRAATATPSAPSLSFTEVPTGRYMLEFWAPNDQSRGYPSRTLALDTGERLEVDI